MLIKKKKNGPKVLKLNKKMNGQIVYNWFYNFQVNYTLQTTCFHAKICQIQKVYAT